MKSFKETKHERLNEKALNKAIKNVLGELGEYNYNIGRIDFFINRSVFERFKHYNIKLPSWEKVQKEAKRIYNNFDDKGIKKIIYRFENMKDFMDFTISAPSSDIYFDDCNLDHLSILEADEVNLYKINPAGTTSTEINAKKISFNFCDITSFNNFSLLAEEEILIKNSRFNIGMYNSELCSSVIKFSNSYFESKNIKLNAESITREGSQLRAIDIIINSENEDSIEGLFALTVLHNGADITTKYKHEKSKLRKQFISILKAIKNNVSNEIDKEAKYYKFKLNYSSISKILKK